MDWLLGGMAVCPRCGTENAPDYKVCKQCGTALSPAGRPAGRSPALGGTMLGMPAFDPVQTADEKARDSQPKEGQPATDPSATGQPRTDQPGPAPRDLKGTMLGLPSPVRNSADTGHEPPADGPEASPAAKPAPQQFGKTLLGIAQPGIAPVRDGAAPPPPPESERPAQPAQPLPHAREHPAPQPPPAPGAEGKETRAGKRKPHSKQSRLRTLILFGLALIGAASLGALAAILKPKAPEISVRGFEVTREGRDQLILGCDDCQETRVRYQKASASFEDGTAKLLLPAPLDVGQNTLKLQLDGQYEQTVKIRVPVAFRLETDLKGRTKVPPYARVVVRAPNSAKVSIGGRSVPVKDGRAIERIPLEDGAKGQKAAVTKVTKTIPVQVTTPSLEKETTARVEAGVSPLVLDTPAPYHVLSGNDLVVSGHTLPGARVTADEQSTKADETGAFSLTLSSPQPGSLTVQAVNEELVGRYDTVELLEVESAESRPEQRTYDELTADTEARVTGTVAQSRVVGGVTTAVLELQDCADPPCLLRLIYGEPRKLKAGTEISASGLVRTGDPPVLLVAQIH